MICVDITQRDIMQTCFSKYFHHLAIFTGVPAYFHLVGITVAKEQNLHHLESGGSRYPLLDPDTQVVEITPCVR